MITITGLWLPIVVTVVLVWVVSSIVWMVLPWHKRDWRGLPDEEAARNALRGTPPGQYTIPYCQGWKEMKSPEYQRKLEEGPQAFLTVMPNRKPGMGRQFVLWVLYLLATAILIAWLNARIFPRGMEYMEIFCFTAIIGWLAYGWSSLAEGIWFGRPLRAVLTLQLDAIIYALLTAGVFGWLWPESV